MFRYPCSYLIYSEAFDGLPDAAKDYVYRRLWEVLSGSDDSGRFRHLSHADREAILPGPPRHEIRPARLLARTERSGASEGSNTKAEPIAASGVIP